MVKIKDLPKIERPREKLLKNGSENLRDVELLAILLRAGYEGKNVIKLAEEILQKHPLKDFLNLEVGDLVKIKGIGVSKAVTIKAAIELCKRGIDGSKKYKIKIENSKDALIHVLDIANEKKEQLVALFLNARNELIKKEIITIGTINANLISPREIFVQAFNTTAVAVVLAHNHPSGDPTPSDEDIAITEKIISAGKAMDIFIVDHLIVCQQGYISIREEKPNLFI